MELEETLGRHHSDVSGRLPDYLIRICHHTEHFPGNYAYLEIVWYFAGINVFMMTFPVFVIVQKIKVPSNRWLSHMASLTFGIYLSHYVFVFVAYDLLDKEQLPYIVRIISMACLVFLTCYAIVWLMSKSKLTDRFIR